MPVKTSLIVQVNISVWYTQAICYHTEVHTRCDLYRNGLTLAADAEITTLAAETKTVTFTSEIKSKIKTFAGETVIKIRTLENELEHTWDQDVDPETKTMVSRPRPWSRDQGHCLETKIMISRPRSRSWRQHAWIAFNIHTRIQLSYRGKQDLGSRV